MIQGSGTVRYEATGNKKRAILLFVMAAILVIGALWIFQQRDGSTKIMGHTRYRYKEESRQTMTYAGWACILAAGLFVDAGVGMMRCKVELYDDHVEGKSYGMGAPKRFSFPKESVQSIEQFSGGVTIVGGGRKLHVMCDRADEVFSQLQQWQAERAPSAAVPEAPAAPAVAARATVDDGRVKCPQCGTKQSRERDVCYMCGTSLPKD